MVCLRSIGTGAAHRVPELTALLDPDVAFPSGAFVASDALLAALQQLGMRTSVTTTALLDSARFVARLQATAPATAISRSGRSRAESHLAVFQS